MIRPFYWTGRPYFVAGLHSDRWHDVARVKNPNDEIRLSDRCSRIRPERRILLSKIILINRLISNLFCGITAFPLIGWPRKNGIQMIFPVRFPNLFIVNNERRDECTYSVDSCDRCCSSSRVANRSTQTLAVAFFSDTFFFCLSELYFRLATRLRLVPLFHVDKHFSLDKCARLLPRIPVLCSPSRRLFIEEGRQVACCQVDDGQAFVHHVHVEIDIQNLIIHRVKKKSFFPSSN